MSDPRRTIEQLLLIRTNTIEVVARSEGVTSNQEEACLQAAVKWGERGQHASTIDAAVFTIAIGKDQVAVFTITDRLSAFFFRVLILHRIAYESWPDPFRLNEYFPADWKARGELPEYTWEDEIVQRRGVLALEEILKTRDPTLFLGAIQAVVDGGRVLLTLKDAEPEHVNELWQLLPDATRSEVTVANFALSPEVGFHLVLMPSAPEPWPSGYISAEQARDYPEGSYEKSLQTAIEAHDQRDLDRLFSRRSPKQSLQLAILLISVMVIATLIVKWFL